MTSKFQLIKNIKTRNMLRVAIIVSYMYWWWRMQYKIKSDESQLYAWWILLCMILLSCSSIWSTKYCLSRGNWNSPQWFGPASLLFRCPYLNNPKYAVVHLIFKALQKQESYNLFIIIRCFLHINLFFLFTIKPTAVKVDLTMTADRRFVHW